MNEVIFAVDIICDEERFDIHVIDKKTKLNDKYEYYTRQDLTIQEANKYLEELNKEFGVSEIKLRYV